MDSLLTSFINGDDRIIGKVPPLIYQSWKRCRELSLNHEQITQRDILQKPEIDRLLDMNEDLLIAARPILQRVFSFLRGNSYLLVLSDKKGYIIETCGDPLIVDAAKKQISLTVGANWQESLKGTNGVGTVIIEQIPVAIPGWTHYSTPVSFLDCWAAPIRDADGQLAGALNISGKAGVRHAHLMEITTAGAAMIGQSMHMSEIQKRWKHCCHNLDKFGKMVSDNLFPIRAGLIKEHPDGRNVSVHKHNGDLIGSKIDTIIPDTLGYFPAHRIGGISAGTHAQWHGRSGKSRTVFDIAMKAARGNSTVLIQGESGTGKEIIARNIHDNSMRNSKPFLTLNCAAIPANLVESELFGYADGAFTGAKKGGQPGKFELANGGTLFLDEIGDMPVNIQATLLRVLQQKEIYRIGDGIRREINVRIIAATNQDLKHLVDQGKFRLDLYYRLKVIHIAIPPLRERVEDILDLVPYFLQKLCAKHGLPTLEISPEVYQCFLSYAWPGNIRQLENCIESMVALSSGALILTPDDLPEEYVQRDQEYIAGPGNVLSLQSISLERAMIIQTLKESEGNIAAAARKLGIGRTTLYRKLDKFSISYKQLN